MTSPERSSPMDLAFVGVIIAGFVFVFAIGAYNVAPAHAPFIIGILTLIISGLALVALELVKHRNLYIDRARAAAHNYQIQRKRADRLNGECNRYFKAHMFHVPPEVMVRTLASMGDGPIRIRDIGPDTEWYRVATSPQYRHLFDQDDLRKLESPSTSAEDDTR